MAKNALRVGKPVDFSAEVPVYPPFALLAAFAASLLMWRLTGKRLRWLSWPIDSKWVRVAAFVGAASVAVRDFPRDPSDRGFAARARRVANEATRSACRHVIDGCSVVFFFFGSTKEGANETPLQSELTRACGARRGEFTA